MSPRADAMVFRLCVAAGVLLGCVGLGAGGAFPSQVLGRPQAATGLPPSLVFVLLDTARSDRFGAWGNPRPTSPQLDALAGAGVRFERHYANSHATRPSMPQIMSGRYYHASILHGFESLGHPREYYFLERDPAAVLLPEVLRDHGYYLAAISTHPWVAEDSPFGEAFDRIDFLSANSRRGHEDAGPAIDRAIELWHSRPRDRPMFLYVHLLDLHTPRWIPDGRLRFADPLVQWNDRFLPGFEPRFNTERRLWNHNDASDFTDLDRTIYTAAYDTMLAYTDREVGRLLTSLRAEDPGLHSTLVAVVADHGEELGEEGRIGHGGSLAEAVHHIPFILAGAGIRPGQQFEPFSQNVDVTPTIVRLLGVDTGLSPSAFDGRALVERDGTACASCGHRAVYYSWVDYQAVRTPNWLLRLDPEGHPETICRGRREVLWRLSGSSRERVAIAGKHALVAERLRIRIERRLGRRAAHFRAGPRRVPDRGFEVPAEYWRLAADSVVACPSSAYGFGGGRVAGPGWQYVQESFLVGDKGTAQPLNVTVDVPDGRYAVELGVVPIRRLWRLPGFGRWLRESLRTKSAERFVPLGAFIAAERQLTVEIPPALADGHRVLGMRLTPQGAAAGRESGEPTPVNPEELDQLRALGYVE